jgi:hypothetical protein
MAQGQKGRKLGRQKNRSKAHARYHGEKRWLVNKAKKIARHERAIERKAAKLAKPRSRAAKNG